MPCRKDMQTSSTHPSHTATGTSMAMSGRNDSTRETPTVQGASVHGQAAADMHSPGLTADGAKHGADAAELVRNYVEETLEFANEYYAGIHEFEGNTAEEPHDVAAVRLVSRQKKNAAAAVQAPVVLARRSPRVQRSDWVVISPNERFCNVTDC